MFEILKLTFYMFLLTFAIGFIVAFIIQISVRGVEFSQTVRDEKYHTMIKRVRSIKRIRNVKIEARTRKVEEASNSDVLKYYNDKYNNKNDKVTRPDTNEIIEHFYGKD